MSEQSVAVRPQLSALTSLRFVAALCIIVLHATNHGLLPAWWANVADWSKAVSFFFVLSGFVLTYAYAGRRFGLLAFFQARFARIWPAAAVSILIVPLLLPRSLYLPDATSPWSIGTVMAIGLLGLQAWIPVPAVFFGLNAVTWSISVEATFYGFFPLLQRLNTKTLLLVLALLITLGLASAWWVSTAQVPGFSSQGLNQPVWEGWVYINPLARLPEFVIGVVSGRIFLSAGFQRLIEIWQARTADLEMWPDLAEIAAFAILAWLGFHRHAWPMSVPIQVALNQWLSACCFAALLWIAASGRGFACQLLSWKPFVFLGEASYGLYLYHQPLMIRAAQAKGASIAGLQLLPESFLPVLAWSLVVSVVSFLWLEQPAQRLLRPKRARTDAGLAQPASHLSANTGVACVSSRKTIR